MKHVQKENATNERALDLFNFLIFFYIFATYITTKLYDDVVAADEAVVKNLLTSVGKRAFSFALDKMS